MWTFSIWFGYTLEDQRLEPTAKSPILKERKNDLNQTSMELYVQNVNLQGLSRIVFFSTK